MTKSSLAQQFDYIVIGAGVAGLTIASRLSQDPSTTVLLIEAGPDGRGDPRIETPGLLTTLYGDPTLDWDFMTEPQPHVLNRQIPQPRGRVLGGSSALNFSLTLYPSQSDFDAWADLGNEGWGSEEMAPYLRRFHTYQTPDAATAEMLGLDGYMDKDNQGCDGPLPVSFPAVYGPFNRAWNEAFGELGWNSNTDPILGGKLGAFTSPLSVDTTKGTRGYAVAYYTPEVAARGNLSVWTETRVERIIFADDKLDGKIVAGGVQIRSPSESTVVTARREVILAAGSLQTPQLLEVSGIGNAQLLQKHDIPVILDLPGVGENLQDHVIASLSYKVADDQVSGDVMRDPQVVQALLQLYQETKGGPLSGMPISAAYMPLVDRHGSVGKEEIHRLVDEYLPSNSDKPDERRESQRQMLLNPQQPTAEYLFFPAQLHTNPGRTTMHDLLEKKADGNYISILAMLSHPFSRGSIHIKSSDIQEKPAFNPDYLSHPLDLELLARHTQFIDRLVHTQPFQSFLQPESRIPAVDKADLAELDDAKRVVQERLFTCFHPAGSCAMMPVEKGGVVDAQLRIHGVSNVRIVDASIFPLEPSGNIQATVYAVAERAADMIRV